MGTASLSESSQELYSALNYGIFTKNGLNASLVQINSSSQLAAALLSGSANIAAGSGAAIAAADMKGNDLVMIGFDQVTDNGDVWASDSIKSVKDLKGKSVSATSPGSNGDLELDQLLQRNGMQASDVKHQYLGTEAAEVAALKSGAIQAANLSASAASLLAGNKSFHIIASMQGISFPYHVWAVTASYLKTHQEEVTRFVAAENAALGYVHDSANAQRVDAAIADYEKVPASSVDAARKQNLEVKAQTLQLPPSLVKLSFQLAVEEGAGTMPADISSFYDTSFVNSN
ncbi:MAG TPA: ABC transporter substrate-binding protein [Trebonia sp.]|nr:ABC transporter substrate-binding protein [Trebonia sp.]